jgi:uncharacterized protein GlcG (DUF336 family)
MLTKPVLTVAETTKILDAARAEAEKNNWAVTIAVADDGGHLLSQLRLDGCAPVGAYIAPEKARTAALAARGHARRRRAGDRRRSGDRRSRRVSREGRPGRASGQGRCRCPQRLS